MPDFVYSANFDGVECHVGPESSPDAESIVQRARERGHRLIELLGRRDPQSPFVPLLASSRRSAPKHLTCRKRRSCWALFFPAGADKPRLSEECWPEVVKGLRDGSLRGRFRRFPRRIEVDAESLLARARRMIEGEFDRALICGWNLGPRTAESEERERQAFREFTRRRMAASNSDTEKDLLRTMLGDSPARPAESCPISGRPPETEDSRTSEKVVETQQGSSIRVVPRDQEFWFEARGMEVAEYGASDGHGRWPMLHIAMGFATDAARRGEGLQIQCLESHEETRRADPLADNVRVEYLTQAGTSVKQTCWIPGASQFRDILAAGSGVCPTELPPFQGECRRRLGSRDWLISVRLGISEEGEYIRIRWKPASPA